jgi:hypothetical protein
MSLSRFAVSSSFCAWSPGDRDRPERQISISPGPKHLFTDEGASSGLFIKFLQNGDWYEADRADFVRATIPLIEHQDTAKLSARRGA